MYTLPVFCLCTSADCSSRVNVIWCFRLEETSQDLQQTKEKLSQEEFISSELASVQEHLYSTAGQVRSSSTSEFTWLSLFTCRVVSSTSKCSLCFHPAAEDR